MKKTLAILAIAASAMTAMATTLEDAVTSYTTLGTGITSFDLSSYSTVLTGNQVTVSYALNVTDEDLVSALTTNDTTKELVLAAVTDTASHNLGTKLIYNNIVGTTLRPDSAASASNKYTPAAVSGYSALTAAGLSSLSPTTISAAALTYSYSFNADSTAGIPAGSMFVLTVQKTDGTVSTYAASTAGLRYSDFTTPATLMVDQDMVKSIYVFSGAMNAATAASVNQLLLPEPATATLSLLALAGLAARRRRH